MADKDRYTGMEPSVEHRGSPNDDSAIYEVRSPNIPAGAKPIYDEELRAVIGYRHESTRGVFKYYDLDGRFVTIEEAPLESPLFDPIDLLMLGGGLLRALGKGALRGAAGRAAAKAAAKISAKSLGSRVVFSLRGVFRKFVSVRALRFTATTAAHMANPGRRVPLHILHLAIRYGKRMADPQKAKGAAQFVTKMFRNGTEYTLTVVVREKDWTILHFVYKAIK